MLRIVNRHQPRRGYDPETGQVYFDVTVPELDDNAQQRKRPGKRPRSSKPNARGGGSRKAARATGARTLKQMAMREVLSDSRRLTVAHLESLGWSLAKYVWDNLCQRCASLLSNAVQCYVRCS